MNETSDGDVTSRGEGEEDLDPRAAAQLLVTAQRQAERGLDFRSPWLSLVAAGVVLVAFGAVWLSVRSQHPYRGPTPLGLAVLYAVVLVRVGTVLYAHRRARAGVSGRAVRQGRAEGAAVAVSLAAVYLVMGALIRAGASDAVVYGLYVVTAPLIVLGAFWAARSAVREDWLGLMVASALMLVAAASAFAGPRGVWLSDGIGGCVVLVGYAAAHAWQLRASRSGL